VTNSNSSPKILFVDDDPNITRSLWRRFRAVGIEVIRSHNAKEGLVLAMTERPDVILTDHNMPGITGERFIMNLQYNHMTKNIPVIMITGVTFDGKEDFALKRQVLGRGGAARLSAAAAAGRMRQSENHFGSIRKDGVSAIMPAAGPVRFPTFSPNGRDLQDPGLAAWCTPSRPGICHWPEALRQDLPG
jgi:CheY-like chemotaxis protein